MRSRNAHYSRAFLVLLSFLLFLFITKESLFKVVSIQVLLQSAMCHYAD